jgi:hypothetical protein
LGTFLSDLGARFQIQNRVQLIAHIRGKRFGDWILQSNEAYLECDTYRLNTSVISISAAVAMAASVLRDMGKHRFLFLLHLATLPRHLPPFPTSQLFSSNGNNPRHSLGKYKSQIEIRQGHGHQAHHILLRLPGNPVLDIRRTSFNDHLDTDSLLVS